MEVRSEAQRRAATRAILRWYVRHGRTLPWRNIRNPYRLLIAEIMLHQTQVSRVLQHYPRFLRRFPSLRSLARASQADIVIAWRGMGYNNRAVRIHRLARQLSHSHAGKLPSTVEECRLLPGIGRYTAHALLVSVYRRDLPVVDVNVRRVLSRLFWRMPTVVALRPERAIWTLAASLVPHARAYEWSQALMDLGATVCTARAPKCFSCPVAKICASRKRMRVAFLARSRQKPSRPGIPNRIYRGRIIDALRFCRPGLTVTQIGSRIFPSSLHGGGPQLRAMISSLEKDGLVRVRGDLDRAETRICLA
jgi:A/G-specific adenine glycosylase